MRKFIAPVSLIALMSMDKLMPGASLEGASVRMVFAALFAIGVWAYVRAWVDDFVEA